MAETALTDELQRILGKQYVLLQESERVLYSQDIWERGATAAAVAQPADTEQLSAAVAAITNAGYAVIARGGGMSYTKAATPSDSQCVVIDTSRMDKVLEVNKDDMYVTVESGCSWKSLAQALEGTGLRTPYWGTLSGSKATVGGSISQNSVFWGSGQFGSAVESVTSLNVVIADGTIISTGSAAQINAVAFFRHFGPDLTGIFTSDSGALGIKASITLRLTPAMPAREQATFDFSKGEQMLAAMADIARADLASECFAFDPRLTELRSGPDRLANDIRAFAGVLKSSGSIFKAISNGIKIVLSGRRFMKNIEWPMHTMIEQRSDAAVNAAIDQVREIVLRHGGREIENSIPKIVRANPFGPMNSIVGPKGERWAPTHGVVPLSKGVGTLAALEGIFDSHKGEIDKHGIITGYLFSTISTNAMVIEPVFFWPEPLDDIHKQTLQPEFLSSLTLKTDDNPAAHQAVSKIKQEIMDYFRDAGGVHLQIGKSYHYASGIKPGALTLIEQIKAAVDPGRKMNPGVLGL